MAKKMENREHIEGRLYQHELSVKQVKNTESKNYRKDFISGNIEIAVDEDGINVIPVHFTYVSEITNSGGKSPTFSILKKIIDEGKTWIEHGKDAAMKVSINTSLGLNDFFTQNDEHVSLKVNEGGFVNFVDKLNTNLSKRNTFAADMVISGTTLKEAEDDEHQDYLILRGAVFNFRNEVLPVDFVVKDPDGIKYFDNFDITPSTPLFTNVWGQINNIETEEKRETESAFGGVRVDYIPRKIREWVVTGVKPEPYEFDEDSKDLKPSELMKAMQDREIALAEIKRRAEEWKAAQTESNTATFNAGGGMNAPFAADGKFKF